MNGDNVTYFDILKVENILKDIEKVISNKKIIKINYRLSANYSSMSGYFCVEFINFMLKDKTLLDYKNLISPTKDKNDEKILPEYFQ